MMLPNQILDNDTCNFFQFYVNPTGLDETLCQKYCSQIYPETCEFFVYDRTERLCQLFDYNAYNFTSSCNKVGGSRSPDISDCMTQDEINDDPCIVST